METQDKIIIQGGKKLGGTIEIQGAKNEALQVICATLLSEETVTLERVPKILDVIHLMDTLRYIGVDIENLGGGTYTLNSANLDIEKLRTPECRAMVSKTRGALMIAGALLGRFGEAYMSRPGGDKIGIRPIDVHLQGFESLGAKITDKNQEYREIRLDRLLTSDFYLFEISVTGTANIILASVLTKGEPATITIRNAASEPYVVGLCNMLNAMGAQIHGVGTNTLHIVTVPKLSGATHRLSPDFVEAGSFIGLAALTGSEIQLKNITIADLGHMIPYTFNMLGIKIRETKDGIIVPAHKHYKIEKLRDGHIREIYDAPWPGLTPDLLSIFLVVATQAEGVVKIHQKMFEKRLLFADTLQNMGAQVEICDPHRAIVIGINNGHKLHGIEMVSPDIRAGMALLIAALAAEGESVIENADQINRGYENIFERLRALGADIK
jgi:UDP-N-acetylglucosamine 1-carboxyvinyltransferase